MQTVNKMIILSMLLMALSAMTHADEVGNGGGAFVCRDSQGKIESAELVDLFEGRREPYFLNISTTNDSSMESQMNAAVEKIKLHAPDLSPKFKEALNYTLQRKRFIESNEELLEFRDDLQVIGKKGCPREQLANFTPLGVVLVDAEIYNAMDNTNKAALWVHEAIYKVLRGEGDTDSRKASLMTAIVFSDLEIIKFFNEVQKKPIVCREYFVIYPEGWHWAWEPPTYKAEGTEFVAYPFNGKTRIQVLNASGHFLLSDNIVDVHEHVGSFLVALADKVYGGSIYGRGMLHPRAIEAADYIKKARDDSPDQQEYRKDNDYWTIVFNFRLPTMIDGKEVWLYLVPRGLWYRSPEVMDVLTTKAFTNLTTNFERALKNSKLACQYVQ